MVIEADKITQAARIVQNGGLVAFPTETVYGLGANAYDDKAVASIFEVKGRPQFNPLIVHVSAIKQAEDIVCFNDRAYLLAEKFWPAPLTFVLPRKDKKISYLVSAGLDTLAVRMPKHQITLDFLKACKVPVAAPSANISGRVSPTCYKHVAEALQDKVGLILDGGASEVGLESSVIDLAGKNPVLLRAGGVTLEELRDTLGEDIIVAGKDAPSAPRSPGQMLSHYAPQIPVYINQIEPKDGFAFLGFGEGNDFTLNLSVKADLKEAAANLFAFLRRLDECGKYQGIQIAPIPKEGLGLAINDRIWRASVK